MGTLKRIITTLSLENGIATYKNNNHKMPVVIRLHPDNFKQLVNDSPHLINQLNGEVKIQDVLIESSRLTEEGVIIFWP